MMFRQLAVMAFATTALGAVSIGPWQNIRFSGMTAAGQCYLRNEISVDNITTNEILYHNGTSVVTTQQILQNEQTDTYQGMFPTPSQGRNLGLKLQAVGSHLNVVPLPYTGTGLPAFNQLTTVNTDPQDMALTNYMDITREMFSFSGTKFYAAMQNRGGGFPTSINFGTTYFSYMCVIAPPGADPADPNVVVWAFNYMNVPLGGITPGLYKITGTGTDDLIRIGNIDSSIDATNNLLTMSCNIADLLADDDFAAWYNPVAPSFGFACLTSRTTVIPFETVTQDQTLGGKIHPVQLSYNPVGNQAPVLSNPVLHNSAGSVWFEVSYTDAQGNFPLDASVSIPGGQSFQLFPQSFDHTQSVIYRTADLTGQLNEYDNTTAVFTCSDDLISYATAELPFFYILGLPVVQSVQILPEPGGLMLRWSQVTISELGNPVTVSHYRLESSAYPDFISYTTLGETINTDWQIPVQQQTDSCFYRIVAVKQ